MTKESSTERKAAPLRGWHLAAFAIPYVALLCPFFYFHEAPTLWSVPFFFWYQFLWIFLSAGVTALVYVSIRR